VPALSVHRNNKLALFLFVYRKVVVKANANNSGIIYIGNNTLTTSNGYPLAAGEQVEIAIDDTSQVYVVADTVDQNYSWLGI